jgi:uncharacterized protein (DUF433 family)
MVPHPHVRVDRNVFAGSPYVAGTRVLVRRLWQWHAQGVPFEAIARRYPQVPQAKLLDALSFAHDNAHIIEADIERERRMLTRAQAS